MKKKILKYGMIILISIQVIPYGRQHNNPPVLSEPNWNNTDTKRLFFQLCKDCHSHETEWPWYSYVAPASWLVQRDVNEGRKHFNVSMWGEQKENEGEEAAEELRKGDMPPWFYYLPHSDKRLSKADKEKLVDGLVKTFGEENDHKDSREEDEDFD